METYFPFGIGYLEPMELDREKIIFGIDDNYDDKNNFIKILKRPFRKS